MVVRSVPVAGPFGAALTSGVVAFAIAQCLTLGCRRRAEPSTEAPQEGAALVTAPSATAPGAPRPGMIWIPAGVLRAGTPVDRAPRVANEELPGTEIALGGFYIDALPYPNEAGAIPTAAVTRDEAASRCAQQNKRLCTELEWERACKGPENRVYEYGDAYRSTVCGTGTPVEQTAKKPSGERLACKSGFGVLEMHGGVWEWTDSVWARGGAAKGELAVLRGGNAAAGEIVGRCANAIGRAPSTKSATIGFRCCSGPRNEATVDLQLTQAPALERLRPEPTHRFDRAEGGAPPPVPAGPIERALRVWAWRPVPNEELRIVGQCWGEALPHVKCEALIVRPTSDPPLELGHFDTGTALVDVAFAGDSKTLRAVWLDALGRSRILSYAYGRVDVGQARR